MGNPRVAFFEFSCCEGCQLMVSNLEEKLIDLVGVVDIVTFREIMTERSDEYDVAVIEGAITRESEIPRLQKIRDRAKVLIAMGACATHGGINCLKNFKDLNEVKRIVYGDKADKFDTILARPIDAVVKVDYRIYGCPITRDELVEVVSSILLGKKPYIPDYPVCVECKMNENVCMYHTGRFCLGAVTRAGCNSKCPSAGTSCEGCRGLFQEANIESLVGMMQDVGYDINGTYAKLKLYNGWMKELAQK